MDIERMFPTIISKLKAKLQSGEMPRVVVAGMGPVGQYTVAKMAPVAREGVLVSSEYLDSESISYDSQEHSIHNLDPSSIAKLRKDDDKPMTFVVAKGLGSSSEEYVENLCKCGAIKDGEIVVMQSNGVDSFSRIQNILDEHEINAKAFQHLLYVGMVDSPEGPYTSFDKKHVIYTTGKVDELDGTIKGGVNGYLDTLGLSKDCLVDYKDGRASAIQKRANNVRNAADIYAVMNDVSREGFVKGFPTWAVPFTYGMGEKREDSNQLALLMLKELHHKTGGDLKALKKGSRDYAKGSKHPS